MVIQIQQTIDRACVHILSCNVVYSVRLKVC